MNAVQQYFKDIWDGIATTYKGMRLTLSYFFKPKVTMLYPEERPEISEGHRGIHIYIEEKCNLCRACETACPVSCIAIKALGKGKDRMMLEYDIDYSKCLFCNLCCEACGSDCLFMGQDYDIAVAEKAGCMLHFAKTKSEEEVQEHMQMLAKKEAEKKEKAAKQEVEGPKS